MNSETLAFLPVLVFVQSTQFVFLRAYQRRNSEDMGKEIEKKEEFRTIYSYCPCTRVDELIFDI